LQRLHVIPNGVPLEDVRAAAEKGPDRAALGLPADAKVVVHIGRFIPQKRQDWTYEAIRELREELGDVHVIFAGEGPMEEELKRRAHEEAATWAHFLGYRTDIPGLLALGDLAVLPSATEALPMVVIEALALGVPQVATDVGDVRDVLEGSHAGLVVAPDDRAGFVAACRVVLGDPERAGAMRAAAPPAAQAYAVETMAERYETLFAHAVAEATGTRASTIR
jgi:glycosyltransferase involved in cell wall biosynthesis